NRTVPTQVGTSTNWEAVAAGGSIGGSWTGHTLAIKTNGTLWAWGGNGSGQLGLGDTTNRTVPNQVGTDADWKLVGAMFKTIAMKSDGTLWSWGGDGITVPTQVGIDTDWWAQIYGVNIDPSTGIFSGYAWAGGGEAGGVATATIGWISFATSSLVSCPSGSCEAKLNADNTVSGWARACSVFQSGCSGATSTNTGGWDGWVRLRNTNYGVSLNPSTKEFEGWAAGWDDSTTTAVIGWISFNCNNPELPTPRCTNDYKVMTSVSLPPSTSNLRIDTANWDVCANSLYPLLSWDYSDGTQKRYQIQIATSSDFTTTKICDYTATSPSHQSYPTGCPLNYNTGYNWRLKVWNTDETESTWNGSTFPTLKHAYPSIDFSWAPVKPAVNEVVKFTDNSVVYGGATKSSWLWEFQDGNPASSTVQNPTTTFASTGSKTVKLKVTDSDTFSCDKEKTLNAQSRLPQWKEIKPF
ncbi:PKD domain-containing protein, partial [Patescibacteria group bacterium]|nr:PKD domain-containing protein [Patescibacteria group bacterium]